MTIYLVIYFFLNLLCVLKNFAIETCWENDNVYILFSDEVASALVTGMVVANIDGSQKMLTCTVCRLVCNGDVPMRQHLQSDAHMKKFKR